MGFEPGPNFVRNKEIVGFNFSSEREFGNTEISITRTEVIVIFRVFVERTFPFRVIRRGINGVFFVSPGSIESRNRFNIEILPRSNN